MIVCGIPSPPRLPSGMSPNCRLCEYELWEGRVGGWEDEFVLMSPSMTLCRIDATECTVQYSIVQYSTVKYSTV